jgi:hypothetical protein
MVAMRSSIVCGLAVSAAPAGAALAAKQRPVEPGGKIGVMPVVRGDASDPTSSWWEGRRGLGVVLAFPQFDPADLPSERLWKFLDELDLAWVRVGGETIAYECLDLPGELVGWLMALG